MSAPADVMARVRQSLASARLLLGAGDHTAAVSRAYYAMFYLTRAVLQAEDVSPRTHSGLVTSFGRVFVKTGRVEARWGRTLREVFEARQVADYAEAEAFDRDETERYLELAEGYVEQIAALLES